MGHSQISCEIQIARYNREAWAKIVQMTVAQLDYCQAMTYNQRFMERREQQYGANSDFAQRKAEHEALSRRLEAQPNHRGMHQ